MKFRFLSLLILGFSLLHPSIDASEGESSTIKKIGAAQGRAVLNVASIPWELPKSVVNESKKNGWKAIVTAPGRFIYNGMVRLTSGAQDFFLSPFVVPATKDNTPLTEELGLPDYAWQSTEDSF